jgi:hypothetical protein
MATNAEIIATIKTQTLARIQEITAQPKPNYTIDGQSVRWADYLKQLWEVVANCDAQLSAESPEEVITRGYT